MKYIVAVFNDKNKGQWRIKKVTQIREEAEKEYDGLKATLSPTASRTLIGDNGDGPEIILCDGAHSHKVTKLSASVRVITGT